MTGGEGLYVASFKKCVTVYIYIYIPVSSNFLKNFQKFKVGWMCIYLFVFLGLSWMECPATLVA